MNYLGSKIKLLPFLISTIESVVGNENLKNYVFCEGFAGTGTVGRALKKRVAKIISNDIEYYSFVLNRNYIGNNSAIEDKEIYINELNNNIPLKEGFIYNNYCFGGKGKRLYFSDENGKIIDAVRTTIEEWRLTKRISENCYYFLLCSLLESADKVANTASVYCSFLKKLKKTAERKLVLYPANFEETDSESYIYNEDFNQLITKIEGDILYLDPPYNERQYGANYHILNTIAEYKEFIPKGKTGMREYIRSKYCGRKSVYNEFDYLIKNSKFKYIFLSYNNEGLMSIEDVRQIMSKYGIYDMVETKYQRYKADKTENRNIKADSTIEYIHILKK